MRYQAARSVLFLTILSIILGAALLYLFFYAESLWETAPSEVDSSSSDGAIGILVRPSIALYHVGDTVEAEGVVEVITSAGSVELEIISPEGELWDSGEAELGDVVGRHASFFASFRTVLDSDPSGVYLLLVRYGGVQNTSSILISTSLGLISEILDFHLQNMGGDVVSRVRFGDTVLVAGSVANHGDVSKEFSLIVEVRDENSSIVHSGFVGTSISPGEVKTLNVGWPTGERGVFTVYAYVKDDFQSRRIISNVATLSFQVTP